jgi:hypothetical protein
MQARRDAVERVPTQLIGAARALYRYASAEPFHTLQRYGDAVRLDGFTANRQVPRPVKQFHCLFKLRHCLFKLCHCLLKLRHCLFNQRHG